MLCLQ